MEILKIEREVPIIPQKKKVAAYARVSSPKDEMLHSLAAQVSFYSELIHSNTDWEYAGVYADEGITGTKATRPEFQRLLCDCRNGKIDIVLTKSLSRFARNTVTTIETVRELRNLGIDIWFEREKIHTLSEEGEFLLTLLASFAQEESRSASENQKWKIRHSFEEGKLGGISMLGYQMKNGELEVIPEEAETVKMIFSDYLSGMGVNAIVKKLIKQNVPTKNGANWHESVVEKMLRNEKYMGDARLQKVFRTDHITKKTVKNTGQLPQYYVEGNHEAIIDKATFDAVQAEISRRKKTHSAGQKGTYPFTGKILCENCGKNYRRIKTAKGYKWSCRTYASRGKAFCDAKPIPENILEGIIEDKPFTQIRVISHGEIKVIWANGKETVHNWSNPSRAESWTPEMKEQVGERRKAWLKNQLQ